jgi:3-dehydroquinate synthase II
MKELWIEIEKSLGAEEKENLIKSSIPICDALLLQQEDFDLAVKLGAKRVASAKGGHVLVLDPYHEAKMEEAKKLGKEVAVKIAITGKKDEEFAVKVAERNPSYLIVNCLNWKIIPLENLISKTRGKTKLIAEVSSVEEAKVALETLELGANGVLLKTCSVQEIERAASLVKAETQKIELVPARVVRVKALGSGARVCVDTCDLMKPGEGILVGCQSAGLFLMEAEIHESPHVEPRPFRVNAGPVFLYVLTPGNKTRYLSELKAGDEILIVDREGKTRVVDVGRIKIERRPMMLIEAEHKQWKLKTIVQNAETIHLVTAKGSIPVSDLKAGDEVLVRLEEGGRHFGTLVKEEFIIER